MENRLIATWNKTRNEMLCILNSFAIIPKYPSAQEVRQIWYFTEGRESGEGGWELCLVLFDSSDPIL